MIDGRRCNSHMFESSSQRERKREKKSNENSFQVWFRSIKKVKAVILMWRSQFFTSFGNILIHYELPEWKRKKYKKKKKKKNRTKIEIMTRTWEEMKERIPYHDMKLLITSFLKPWDSTRVPCPTHHDCIFQIYFFFFPFDRAWLGNEKKERNMRKHVEQLRQSYLL